ncbi:MAG: NADPH-dependent FMN reductase [Leucobacter sp.]
MPERSTEYTVALIVGSASEPSLNRRFAAALTRLAPDAALELRDVPITRLPFYGTQYDSDFPAEGRALKEAIESADGLLIVTPEYNRSIPGVLKNAIDWATRPGGKSSLTGKPTAVTGATKGAISTALAQGHLKSILASQGAPLVGPPEAYIRIGDDFFDGDGAIASERTREFLLGFLRQLHELIERWS